MAVTKQSEPVHSVPVVRRECLLGPVADFGPFDRDTAGGLDAWRRRRDHYYKVEAAKRLALLFVFYRDGTPLYRLTPSGNIKRTRPVSPAVRRQVIKRDEGLCVYCGSTGPLEVDHIIRYIDGGTNHPDNLRTLCAGCHRARGGAA